MRSGAFLVGWALLGCLALPWAGADPPRRASRWHTEVVFKTEGKLNGVVVADLDPARPGDEIAAVGESGAVFLAWREGNAWKHAEIARTHGELISVAAGDVDSRSAGAELVVGGMFRGKESDEGQGVVHVLRRDGVAWAIERAFLDGALVHGVCVHDVDPDRPGLEVVVSGFSRALTVLTRDGDAWRDRKIATLPNPAKQVTGHGAGVLVACVGGELVEAHARPGDGRHEVRHRETVGLARVASDGQRIVAACDDGGFLLFTGTLRLELHREGQKLRGAVWAELDPAGAGIECATAGYEGRVRVFRTEETGWDGETVVEGLPAIHHVAAGDMFPDRPGAELAVACLDGSLRVMRRK